MARPLRFADVQIAVELIAQSEYGPKDFFVVALVGEDTQTLAFVEKLRPGA